MEPALPDNMDRYQQLEAQYASATPGIVFLGDSRAALWPAAQMAQLGSSPTNLGISGESVQQVMWRLINSGVNIGSAATVIIVAGTNNICKFNEAPVDVAFGLQQLARIVRNKNPTARILTHDCYETTYDATYRSFYTDARRRELNRRARHRATQSGLFTHVSLAPMDVNDASLWLPATPPIPGQIHLTPTGYLPVTAAVLVSF